MSATTPRDGDATATRAPPGAEEPPLLPPPSRGGFKIPKRKPAPPPPPPPPPPPTTTDADASATTGDRASRRAHRPRHRKHKHLLVVDLNGLLVDRRMSPHVAPDGTKVAPDGKFGRFLVYNRAHIDDFIDWIHERFTVGVWSSAREHNARALVNHAWGAKRRDKLAFVWGQDRCTHAGAMDPRDGPRSKPILLKDLRKLWATPSYARFGPSNTLLLDDSPYKAVMNPPHTALHPAEYVLGSGDDAEENLLGEGASIHSRAGLSRGRTFPARPSSPFTPRRLPFTARSSLSPRDRPTNRPTNRIESIPRPLEPAGPSTDGALRKYLARLAESDSVPEFVMTDPWANHGAEAPPSDADVMEKARRGGEAVAAAELAAERAGAGGDANEIELPPDDDGGGGGGDGAGDGGDRNEIALLDEWGGSDDDEREERKSTDIARAVAGGGEDEDEDRPGPAPAPRAKKPKRVFTGAGASLFIRRWAWKREAKSDEERFELPYEHEVAVAVAVGDGADGGDGATQTKKRSISMRFNQARFDAGGAAGGFASSVWDSAIVLAKHVEKRPELFRGKRVVELGAGCGLVSAVLLAVGASRVVATDLPENLELLRGNVRANAAACGAAEEEDGTSTAAEEEDGTSTAAPTTPTFAVKALRWGEDAASALGETFDVVVAADCMYVEETAGELADATRALAPAAVFSYGRNRQAEDAFADACGGEGEGEGGGGGARVLAMEDVPEDELDELYQCSDVRVVRLRMRAKKA